MSSTYAASFDRLDECLDELAAVDPIYRTTGERQEALTGWARFIARAQAEWIRVLAASDDIAETTGARSTATWLADATRDAHGTVRRHAALAAALDKRWGRVAEAFAAGELNLAQVREIVGPSRRCRRTWATTCWSRPRRSWSSRPPSSVPAS